MSTTRRVHHVPRHRRHGAPSSRSKLLQASVVMAAGSLVSRLLGFVRNFLFGAILGGSMSAAANSNCRRSAVSSSALASGSHRRIGGCTRSATSPPPSSRFR